MTKTVRDRRTVHQIGETWHQDSRHFTDAITHSPTFIVHVAVRGVTDCLLSTVAVVTGIVVVIVVGGVENFYTRTPLFTKYGGGWWAIA